MSNVYVTYHVHGKNMRIGPYTFDEALRELRDIGSYEGVTHSALVIESAATPPEETPIPTFAERLMNPII